MPYMITQCYLPPGRADIPAFSLKPSSAGYALQTADRLCATKRQRCRTVLHSRLTFIFAAAGPRRLPRCTRVDANGGESTETVLELQSHDLSQDEI